MEIDKMISRETYFDHSFLLTSEGTNRYDGHHLYFFKWLHDFLHNIILLIILFSSYI